MEIKENMKKFWEFLSGDSLASWFVSLILIFIIVKFIFFPFLSVTLGTSMPLVVVESGSMHHPGSFVGNVIGSSNSFDLWWDNKGRWYEGKGIEKEEAEKWTLKTGLEIGDIVVVSRARNAGIGDIIIFDAEQRHPLIHRIIDIKNINGEVIYSTKGDNNEEQIYFEKYIPKDALIGKAVFRIPKIGWVKLVFAKIVDKVI